MRATSSRLNTRVTLSWRSKARGTAQSRPGYKVVHVPFKDGRPEGYYENFATGFWISGEQRAEVWGRPAALAVAKDGSLLVADDTGGTIWRISFTGKSGRADARPDSTGSAK